MLARKSVTFLVSATGSFWNNNSFCVCWCPPTYWLNENCLRLQGLEGSSAAIVPRIEGLNKRPTGSLYDKWFQYIKHPLVVGREGFTLQDQRFIKLSLTESQLLHARSSGGNLIIVTDDVGQQSSSYNTLATTL